jgi:alpha-tubulin suppressor-like RCC1 family protein
VTRVRMMVIGLCLASALGVGAIGAASASAASVGAEAWGANGSGQLGTGTTVSSDQAAAVGELSEVTAVSGGGAHSLALLANGTVVAWGSNTHGELGNGTTTNSDVPVAVSGLSGVTAIAAGGSHSLALLSNGTVMAWGYNANGQLGNGTIVGSDVPVAVSGLSGVTAISAGAAHSLALLSNGTMMAWGANLGGQLGNGTTNNGEVTPVAVTGLSGVTAISAGANHSLALISGGTVMSWGANSQGQLGNGTTTNSDVPVAVSGLTGVTAISGGDLHTLALLSSGSMMAWGSNGRGQLGNNSTTSSSVPVAVTGLTEVSAIAAGGHHSLALRKNTTVMAWGDGGEGQLGNSATKQSNIPVAVSNLTGVKGIDAGEFHSLAFGPQIPAVTGVTPTFGPAAGGTSVTIKGQNFHEVTAVKFGATSVLFTVITANEITATSPAGTGIVDVTVTTAAGVSADNPADRFSYLPTVSSVSPAKGPQAGGTSVTITGTNFVEVTAVKFGANNATSFTVTSSTSITATSPAGFGPRDVTVTTAGGTSATSSADVFTYENTPPEFGTCIKASGTGLYSNTTCTKLAAIASEKKFEWIPGPPPKPTFATKIKIDTTFLWEAVGGAQITCVTEKSSTGEYTNNKTVGGVVLLLTGCTFGSTKCTSAGSAEGGLKTVPLSGEVGIIKTGTEPLLNTVGLDLKASGGGAIVEFTCGGVARSWTGSVIVPLKANKMLATQTLKWSQTKGLQKPEQFEGQPKDIIEGSKFGGEFEQSAWALTTVQTDKEKIELNTVV